MQKTFLIVGSVLGMLSVILGAFGAHVLKTVISSEAINIFETAVRYQFYHVFALIATGILYKEFPLRYTIIAGYLFIYGIILFSGSLYILTYFKGAAIVGYNWIGMITPLGGLLLIAGWIFLTIACASRNRLTNTP